MSTSIVWGFLCLFACLLTTHFANLQSISNYSNPKHNKSLDGLKGILAVSVYICHASSWQHYLAHDQWQVSSTPFYVLPAQTSVIIFFMLTGFLFCKKIIGSKEKKTTWIEIYIARFLRLAPVYILMLIILALAIGWGVFKDYIDASKCRLEDALSWLLFTIPGAPLLCEYKRTNVMTSGVTWSLTYEWLFYFSLPALAQIIGKKPPLPLLLASIFIASAIAFILPFYPVVYLSFLVGIISGYFDHKHHSQNLEKKLWVGLASIAILIGNGFLNNQTSYTILSVFLIGISFHIFASGNSLAGILKTRTFQTLGLCTYSTYLLHGLALFITLTTVKKIIPDIHTNDVTYWTTIILMSPVLIFFCLLVHISIEFPMIKKTKFVVAYIAAKTRGLRSINH